MDETKRANRLWRHVVGSARAEELLFEEGDELFDIGVARTLDERFLLVGSESKDSSEWRVADADSQRRRAVRAAHVFARRADIEYDVAHRAGRFYVRINDTGRNFRLVSVDAAAPDLADADELIAARADVMLDDVDVFASHLAVTERVAGSLQLRIVDLARRRAHGRLRRAGVQRPHERQRRVRDRPAALRLHLADDAGVDLRLRPGDTRARAEEAPAGPRLRSVAVRERAHHGDRQGRHRGADLARLPDATASAPSRSRSCSTATAATASRSTRRSRRRASRCSIAAWCSRSPTSAAAATSAAAGTRPARWRRSRPRSTTSSPAPRR